MNMNDSKNVTNRVSNVNNKQNDKPKVGHKDRGDANKFDTTNARKNEETTKFKNNKLKFNVDKSHNAILTLKSDKREVTEVKDLKKDKKNQKDDKAKISEDVGKNSKKLLPKTNSNKEAIKNAADTNKLTEPKSQKTLRITIPNINEKKEKTKKSPKNMCRTDVKGAKNRPLSPILTKKASPSTEVSKWSGNKLAKPYYDAWVNFAGVSKNMTMLEKNTRFQKQLKRYRSPELLYENYADEKFTGRIKVNYK